MNNFVFDEMLATEYRQDRMVEAEEYRRAAWSPEKKGMRSVYRALARMGDLLENWGANMKARYDHLAQPEPCDMLPDAVK